MGKSWLVCVPCRRYTPLIGGDHRDTRFTTFSCSVCGGEGKHVFDDPHKAGLEPDLRPRPKRHPDAEQRVSELAAARQEEEQQRQAAREAAWRRAQRPKPQARPTYKLKPFPVQTFADVVAWGLTAKVYCPECRRSVPIEIGDNLRPLPLFTTRFRRTSVRNMGILDPIPCRSRGQVDLLPADMRGVPNESFLSVCCHCFDHTTVGASCLVLAGPPWQGVLAKGENFGCPGCGRRMAHTWHQEGRGGAIGFGRHLLAPATMNLPPHSPSSEDGQGEG